MGELVKLVIEICQLLWPFRLVRADEAGGWLVCGHWWKQVGPGCYPVVPWFTDIEKIPISKGIVSTPRLDIPLSDGNRLTFSASATAQVIDIRLALLSMDDYRETTQEMLSAILADKLMEVDAERITKPEKRGRLFGDLRRWVQDEASEYGLELSKIRFTSLVVDAPVMRLLNDQGGTQW